MKYQCNCGNKFDVETSKFGNDPVFCECGEPTLKLHGGFFVPYMSYQLSRDPNKPVLVESPGHKKQLMKEMGVQEWSPGIKWKPARKEVSISEKFDIAWEQAKSKLRR